MQFALFAKGIFVQECNINTHPRPFHSSIRKTNPGYLLSFWSSTKLSKYPFHMAKVYPNSSSSKLTYANEEGRREKAEVFTVWRKSLLFNTSGFTVFDANGNLIFRVDNYGSGCKSKVVLMDTTGRAVLTVRRKRQLGLGEHWMIYKEEDMSLPLLCVKFHTTLLHVNPIAHVTPFSVNNTSTSSSYDNCYTIDGSYAQRSCVLNDKEGRMVGEICQKDVGGVSFGNDVFRLVVGPELNKSLAMGIVIALDQMAGSRPYLIRSWSS